jgi:acyl carrier protein
MGTATIWACDHMHPAWPMLLAIIGPMLPTPRAVEPGTLLADLGLDDLDRDVIAMELGDATGIHIGDDAARRWLTISDVLASAQLASRGSECTA